jgi:peptidase E
MNVPKPVYLIAGRGDRKSFKSIIKTILKDTGKIQPTIAYVGVASGDNWPFYLMISAMIKEAGDCQIRRVLIAPKKADLNKAQAVLESADAIFMSGGDVEAGMRILEEKNMAGFLTDLFKRGKVLFGVSAGSIMLAREWVRWRDPEDDSTTELFPCLGITPIICDTHAEADDWEELKSALKLKEEDTQGYGIPSGSCLKVYPDGRVEALDGAITQFLKRGNSIVKQPELLPRREVTK